MASNHWIRIDLIAVRTIKSINNKSAFPIASPNTAYIFYQLTCNTDRTDIGNGKTLRITTSCGIGYPKRITSKAQIREYTGSIRGRDGCQYFKIVDSPPSRYGQGNRGSTGCAIYIGNRKINIPRFVQGTKYNSRQGLHTTVGIPDLWAISPCRQAIKYSIIQNKPGPDTIFIRANPTTDP